MYKGILIPIGGNEDKGVNEDDIDKLDFVNDGILSRVVRESGGINSKIIIVPTASSIPIEVADMYLEAFGRLGCTNVSAVFLAKRSDCEMADNIEAIKTADCIMFSGGDQSKISDIIGGTVLNEILQYRMRNEEIVIAGTSAGAMAMSFEMICGGRSDEALLAGSVCLSKGLNLMPSLIIDSHFIARGRFGRLAEAVAHFPDLIGVGLGEDTGLIIRGGNRFTVIGSGMVILFDGSHITHNNAGILEEGTPMTIAHLTTHVLSNSDQYVIDERKVIVLPIDAAFEI